SGKIDVLVGTQMIAKGLDFPNVTLVGMVDADLSLHIPDFRANERTFQLLVQVSGRAGRGDLAGEVVVQTFTPHADPIQFARRGEVDAFLDVEAESRERFQYPPYRHLIRQVFRGPNPDKVLFFAEQFAKRVEAKLGKRVELRGPVPCSIEKMKDNYRFQVWYFTSNIGVLMAELVGIAGTINWPSDVIQVLDADPISLS
ncbi:MAG: primosomal protein N', partial [Opitutales bacterium]|nr:primosomal protein N' [Opitutales bacterium]